MPFVAGSIIVGNTVVKEAEYAPSSTTGEGSFQALREKVYNLPPVKVRKVDDRLIQYKESAFLSDMLSSSKD